MADGSQAGQPPALQLQAGNLPQNMMEKMATMSAQKEQLAAFWREQLAEIQQVGTDPAEFKNHQLPLARIKKIMKSDEDVRMISAEAPVLFARACEMFILELTHRSWAHSEENKRRTLQRNDIAAAITRTDIFDFLVDIVPREDRGADDAAAGRPAGMPGPQGGAPLPPFALPPGMQIPGVSGAMVGGPGGIDPSAMFGGVHGFPPQWPPLAGSGFIPPPVSLSNDGHQQQQHQLGMPHMQGIPGVHHSFPAGMQMMPQTQQQQQPHQQQ